MVKRILFTCCLLFCMQLSMTFANQDCPYYRFYEQLQDLHKWPVKSAEINNFTLSKDVATFNLLDGKLYFLYPDTAGPTAAVFLGKGNFYFEPPSHPEKQQLYRYYDTEILEYDFYSLFMFFTDRTAHSLLSLFDFADSDLTREAKTYLEDAKGYIVDSKGKWIDPSITHALLEGSESNLFYAMFGQDKYEPLFLMIDPYAIEEVKFFKRARTRYLMERKEQDIVCQFPANYSSLVSMPTGDSKAKITLRSYDIESTIKSNLDFSAKCDMTFHAREDSTSWLCLKVSHEIEIDSIKNSAGHKLQFAKEKDNPNIWVQLDPALQKNKIETLSFWYQGDILEQDRDGWIYLKTSTRWYPNLPNSQLANFNLVFHTDEKFDFLSIGTKIHEQKNGDMITTTWQSEEPCIHASFNLGYFKSHQLKVEGIPPISVYMNKYGRTDLRQQLVAHGISVSGDMEKNVAADVANSISFYQDIYGKPIMSQFTASEIPFAHGQAFPGMIHLSLGTFLREDKIGYNDLFRAHEVAHQWWGLGVGYDTYHDAWISEAFAEFSALWFVHASRGIEPYFQILRYWKELITSNRKYILRDGKKAGPIWMGPRTHTTETEGDYSLIIYKKGAWVLHMLRNLFIDLHTLKDDKFKALMREIYTTYVGKKATTADIQRIVEKYAGENMDWFFRQWIYGTAIPEYEFAYRVDQKQKDEYVVTCKVQTKGVDDDFKMYVPLLIQFDEQQFARVRYPIQGKSTTFELPVLPMKPEKIYFNDLESVLCTVEYTDF